MLFIEWTHDNYNINDWRRQQIMRKSDTVIFRYSSNHTILNINRIHPSQTYVTDVVVLQYSDMVLKLNGVSTQIGRCCPLANPSYSDNYTIDQILADFPRILSRTEDLSVEWNTRMTRYLLPFSYFDSALNFGRLVLMSLLACFLVALDR